jgi:hypothetical protein
MLGISELGLLDDPFPDLLRPRARRRVSKSKLRAKRLAKRNAVIMPSGPTRLGPAERLLAASFANCAATLLGGLPGRRIRMRGRSCAAAFSG